MCSQMSICSKVKKDEVIYNVYYNNVKELLLKNNE